MPEVQQIKVVRELLRIAGEVAGGSDRVGEDWLIKLRGLASELEQHGSSPTVAEASRERAAVIVREIGPATRVELILLPPDPPKLEDCPQCSGRRIEGSDKP